MTILEITRPKAYIAMMVPHKIVVDDHIIGAVHNGRTLSFEVSPGQHIIQVRQSMFVQSNSISLACFPNQTIRLQITQQKPILQLVLAIVGPGLLLLKKRPHLNLERMS